MASLQQPPPPTSDNFRSVQELMKEPLLSVPHEYNLSNQIFLNRPTALNPRLPIIDMMELLVSTDSEVEKLHSSLKEWGFFQLVNHGVSSSLLDQLKHEIENFHKLPLEEKMKYKPRPGEIQGYGQVRRPDGKLEWGDRLYMTINPISSTKPYLMPELPSSLRNTLEMYFLEMQKLSIKVLRFIAKALRVDEEVMEEMFDNGWQSVRMNYFPPCPQPDLVAGLLPHSDATGITIVNQINGVDGLQIKKDGVWVPVSFLPDALVVNAGDTLEILSNGIYRSVEHYVTVNRKTERMSVAFFVNPKLETEIGPIPTLVNAYNPPQFRRVLVEKYLHDFYERNPRGKSNLEQMKITANTQNAG